MSASLSLVSGRSVTPLERLVRDYLNHCRARRLSGKTIDLYRPQLERIFLPWCQREGVTDVEGIGQRILDRFAAELRGGERKSQLSPHTVSAYLRTVNTFLAWARSEGEAVTAKAHLPKTPQKIVETLTRAEIAAMEKAGNERDGLIVRLLADTGIRAGELVALRVVDLIEHERHDYLQVLGRSQGGGPRGTRAGWCRWLSDCGGTFVHAPSTPTATACSCRCDGGGGVSTGRWA